MGNSIKYQFSKWHWTAILILTWPWHEIEKCNIRNRFSIPEHL